MVVMTDYSELARQRYEESLKVKKGPWIYRIFGWLFLILFCLFLALPYIAIIGSFVYEVFIKPEEVYDTQDIKKVREYTREDYEEDVLEEMRLDMDRGR